MFGGVSDINSGYIYGNRDFIGKVTDIDTINKKITVDKIWIGGM
jgi:hypothetical protein